MYILSSASRYQVQPQEVTIYVARNDGSVLLSCASHTCTWFDIAMHTRLDYLPPRASLTTSSADHPKMTKCQPALHASKKVMHLHPFNWFPVPKLITSKEQILASYILMCLMELDAFPEPPYQISCWCPSITPKQTPCRPIPVHLKEPFKQETWQGAASRYPKACTSGHTLDKQLHAGRRQRHS